MILAARKRLTVTVVRREGTALSVFCACLKIMKVGVVLARHALAQSKDGELGVVMWTRVPTCQQFGAPMHHATLGAVPEPSRP